MQDVFVVAYGRSAVGKGSKKGALYHSRPDDIAAEVLRGVVDKLGPDFDESLIEDVIVGNAFPEGIQGFNIARTIALRAGLPLSVPGQTINRWCSSGLQTIANAAYAIATGEMSCVAAGGVELMSTTPIGGSERSVNPYLEEHGPSVGIPMGVTAENVADEFGISAQEQNEFAVQSHMRAHAAQVSGRFEQEIIPVTAKKVTYDEKGFPSVEEVVFDQDEGIRPNSSVESLAKLPTIFKAGGSVTAGNASQVSDGAGFVILMSGDKVKELGIKPIAKFVSFQAVGVDPAIMGIGPVYAIPEVLESANLTLDDIDLIELNEAFASQALASIKELNINTDITNVNGGAIALGHPLGATGAILTARLLSEMSKRPDSKYGLVSMCIGNGMGAAGIFEYIH